MKRRMSLSAPSSQLHPPRRFPRDGQYPGVLTSGNIAVTAKVERPGSTSSSPSTSALRGWDAAVAVACARGASRSRTFSVLVAALALLGGRGQVGGWGTVSSESLQACKRSREVSTELAHLTHRSETRRRASMMNSGHCRRRASAVLRRSHWGIEKDARKSAGLWDNCQSNSTSAPS
jgi:hypothetical protein